MENNNDVILTYSQENSDQRVSVFLLRTYSGGEESTTFHRSGADTGQARKFSLYIDVYCS